MSEAESKFRDVISNAIVTLQENVSHPIHGEYVDAIVGSLKLDDWLVASGQIYEARYPRAHNWDDNYTMWRLDTVGLEGYYYPNPVPVEEDDE